MSKHLIYGLSSTSNPDLIKYIGYTKKASTKRLMEHLSESRRRKTKKDKWIQKELLSHKICVTEIDECDSVEVAKKLEISYISQFKSFGANLKNGTSGGDGAANHKCPESLKQWNTQTKSKEIFVYNFNSGEFIESFPSSLALCKERSLNRSGVGYVLSGEIYHYRGLWFSYTKQFNPIKKRERTVWNKGVSTKGTQKFKTAAVGIIDLADNSKIIFNTVNETAIFLGIRRESVTRILTSNNPIYKKRFKLNYE
jgi:hypothetical protein